jgi:chromosome segregation ATPase
MTEIQEIITKCIDKLKPLLSSNNKQFRMNESSESISVNELFKDFKKNDKSRNHNDSSILRSSQNGSKL